MTDATSTASPMTVITLFAGMVEASAMASLPLLDDQSKAIYVWLLVGFPPLLTLLFFVTLNFNRQVLGTALPEPAATASDIAPPPGLAIELKHRLIDNDAEIISNFSGALRLLRQQCTFSPHAMSTLVLTLVDEG